MIPPPKVRSSSSVDDADDAVGVAVISFPMRRNPVSFAEVFFYFYVYGYYGVERLLNVSK